MKARTYNTTAKLAQTHHCVVDEMSQTGTVKYVVNAAPHDHTLTSQFAIVKPDTDVERIVVRNMFAYLKKPLQAHGKGLEAVIAQNRSEICPT